MATASAHNDPKPPKSPTMTSLGHGVAVPDEGRRRDQIRYEILKLKHMTNLSDYRSALNVAVYLGREPRDASRPLGARRSNGMRVSAAPVGSRRAPCTSCVAQIHENCSADPLLHVSYWQRPPWTGSNCACSHMSSVCDPGDKSPAVVVVLRRRRALEMPGSGVARHRRLPSSARRTPDWAEQVGLAGGTIRRGVAMYLLGSMKSAEQGP